jgi:hypothetical protein
LSPQKYISFIFLQEKNISENNNNNNNNNISEYNIISVVVMDPGTTTAHAGSQWHKKYDHFIFAEIWRMVGLCLI